MVERLYLPIRMFPGGPARNSGLWAPLGVLPMKPGPWKEVMAQRRLHSPYLVPGWLWGGSETSGVGRHHRLVPHSVSETPDPRGAQLTAATTTVCQSAPGDPPTEHFARLPHLVQGRYWC